MRIPRPLRAFIPFDVLARALDGNLSKKERILYGSLFAIFVLALIGGILNKLEINLALSDFIRLFILIAYACAMIYVMIVGGLSTFRMGKAAQGFSKAGYRIFGALCIFLGVTLIVALPCALYYTYSQ